MRTAKITTIYNDMDEVFTGTIREFLDKYEGTIRTNLYRARGTTDDEGVAWRVGELPLIQKRDMTDSELYIFNVMQSIASGKEVNRSLTVEEANKVIACYNRQFITPDSNCIHASLIG